jgi:hypothetical protein
MAWYRDSFTFFFYLFLRSDVARYRTTLKKKKASPNLGKFCFTSKKLFTQKFFVMLPLSAAFFMSAKHGSEKSLVFVNKAIPITGREGP